MQNSNSLNTSKDIRFTIELAELKDLDYRSVKERQKIEFIGYEVSNAVLKENKLHHFIFDSYCRQELERLHSEKRPVYFVIRATCAYQEPNSLIDWHNEKDPKEARLVIKYIERRKGPLPSPINVETRIENGIVKLSWENPKSDDFIGSYVVRNPNHPPKSPFDGGKLYAGKDEYTLDNYGNPNIPKYYSVFSYDNVPNYSAPASVYYKVTETISIDEDFDDYDTIMFEYDILD